MDRYELKKKTEGDTIFAVCALTDMLERKHTFEIAKHHNDEEFMSSKTATTDMRDFIGNIIAYVKDGDKCTVQGHFRGQQRQVVARIVDDSVNRDGGRVMCTDHLNVSGEMEYIVTSRPIIQGNINFLNIGWIDKKTKHFRHLRIDVYTGESREIR